MLSRRLFLGSSIATGATSNHVVNNPKLEFVKLNIHGGSCYSDTSKDGLREKFQKLSVAEEVMRESKLFYLKLYNSDSVNQEIYEHFSHVRKIASNHDQFKYILDEMLNDVQEFQMFSDCLEI
jgi:hypothetical protein